MSTFIGNIEARADEKGRIFVPAAYRKILNEAESKRIVMRRDTDNECLIFYPEQVWNEKVGQLRQALDEWDPEDQMLLMQFMSDAEFLDMDNQGRILLRFNALGSSSVPKVIPSAVNILRTSSLSNTLCSMAFSTFKILPRNGKIA